MSHSQRFGATDTTVSSVGALQAAFDDLSPGETLYISAANAPYRTTEWLDIDVDDVAVVGPGLPDLVKPADGADVGGIRIGHNSPCENVVVSGFGVHGNRDRQHTRATRLHGIAVRDADNVTLVGNHVRRTHPIKHGDGGSGISVTRRCTDLRIGTVSALAFVNRDETDIRTLPPVVGTVGSAAFFVMLLYFLDQVKSNVDCRCLRV